MSKPISSTVLAALAGEKAITWDDRIMDLDPGFRMNDPWVTQNVTLRDMFSHRSGLPDSAGDDLEDLGYGRAEILRRLRSVEPGSSFRSHWAYTNFGITEAAVAAARATGKPWEVLAAEKLYKPLGMASTSSRFDDVAAASNRALLHVSVDGKWVARQTRNPDAQSPAGGVSSTARDLVQWMPLQLGKGKFEGKQLIDANALAETHRPVIVSGTPADPTKAPAGLYALGWGVSYDDKGQAVLNHSGAFSAGRGHHSNLDPIGGARDDRPHECVPHRRPPRRWSPVSSTWHTTEKSRRTGLRQPSSLSMRFLRVPSEALRRIIPSPPHIRCLRCLLTPMPELTAMSTSATSESLQKTEILSCTWGPKRPRIL